MSELNEQRAPPPAETTSRGHEPIEVNFRVVAGPVAGLLVLVVAAMAGTYLLWQSALRPTPKTAPPRELLPAVLPSAPLNPDQPGELKALRAEEAARLSSYGWLDRAENIARIPIGRAMDILVDRGLPSSRPAHHEARPQPMPAPQEEAP